MLGFKLRRGSHLAFFMDHAAWASFQRGPHGFGRVGGDHMALAEVGTPGLGESQDHAALGCSLLPRGLVSRRDFAGKKRGERTLAGGP